MNIISIKKIAVKNNVVTLYLPLAELLEKENLKKEAIEVLEALPNRHNILSIMLHELKGEWKKIEDILILNKDSILLVWNHLCIKKYLQSLEEYKKIENRNNYNFNSILWLWLYSLVLYKNGMKDEAKKPLSSLLKKEIDFEITLEFYNGHSRKNA